MKSFPFFVLRRRNSDASWANFLAQGSADFATISAPCHAPLGKCSYPPAGVCAEPHGAYRELPHWASFTTRANQCSCPLLTRFVGALENRPWAFRGKRVTPKQAAIHHDLGNATMLPATIAGRVSSCTTHDRHNRLLLFFRKLVQNRISEVPQRADEHRQSTTVSCDSVESCFKLLKKGP